MILLGPCKLLIPSQDPGVHLCLDFIPTPSQWLVFDRMDLLYYWYEYDKYTFLTLDKHVSKPIKVYDANEQYMDYLRKAFY